MSGDPRVLAPLQQAYLAANDGSNARTYIRYTWRAETNQHGLPWHQVDADIRGWTPPPAEPSLEQRVDELHEMLMTLTTSTARNLEELRAGINTEVSNRINHEHLCRGRYDITNERINSLEQHPAPQPAPDLDPVRVGNVIRSLKLAYRNKDNKGHMRDAYRYLTGMDITMSLENRKQVDEILEGPL